MLFLALLVALYHSIWYVLFGVAAALFGWAIGRYGTSRYCIYATPAVIGKRDLITGRIFPRDGVNRLVLISTTPYLTPRFFGRQWEIPWIALLDANDRMIGRFDAMNYEESAVMRWAADAGITTSGSWDMVVEPRVMRSWRNPKGLSQGGNAASQ